MDDLTRISGIGKATAKKLAAAGIDTFAKFAERGFTDKLIFDLSRSTEEGSRWIEEATELAKGEAAGGQIPEVPAGAPAAASLADPAAQTATEYQGKPPRPDDANDGRAEAQAVPADGGAGDPHTNTPESEDRGGGDGNPAVPAREDGPAQGLPSLEELIGGGLDEAELEAVDAELKGAQDAFRKIYPHFAAAIDAWQATNEGMPTVVRIRSKREGFRRGGMVHTKALREFAFDGFTSPDQLDVLFGEPVLTVELA